MRFIEMTLLSVGMGFFWEGGGIYFWYGMVFEVWGVSSEAVVVNGIVWE